MADPSLNGTANSPPQSFTLDNTLGAIVVGFAASCVVYGILLTQVWTYFQQFRLDSMVYKFLVIVVLLLETTDQGLIGHFVYFYSVTSAGNPAAMLTGTMTWSLIMQQAIGSIVGAIVKCCFATRVYRFSERNIFITAFLVLLSLGQLSVALLFTIQSFRLYSIPAVFSLKALGTTSLGLGAFTDVLTAAALCFFLQRLRTGYKPADSLVRRLVKDAINTGVLTTAVSLSTLLLFDFYAGNLIFVATYFLLSKLYAVSFLATLNTRRAVRGRGTDAEEGTGDGTPGIPTYFSTRARSAHAETNIFHLGTHVREPSMYDDGRAPSRQAGYPFSMDVKPGSESPHHPQAAHGQAQPEYEYAF